MWDSKIGYPMHSACSLIAVTAGWRKQAAVLVMAHVHYNSSSVGSSTFFPSPTCIGVRTNRVRKSDFGNVTTAKAARVILNDIALTHDHAPCAFVGSAWSRLALGRMVPRQVTRPPRKQVRSSIQPHSASMHPLAMAGIEFPTCTNRANISTVRNPRREAFSFLGIFVKRHPPVRRCRGNSRSHSR
jgi:hypothetical protein